VEARDEHPRGADPRIDDGRPLPGSRGYPAAGAAPAAILGMDGETLDGRVRAGGETGRQPGEQVAQVAAQAAEILDPQVDRVGDRPPVRVDRDLGNRRPDDGAGREAPPQGGEVVVELLSDRRPGHPAEHGHRADDALAGRGSDRAVEEEGGSRGLGSGLVGRDELGQARDLDRGDGGDQGPAPPGSGVDRGGRRVDLGRTAPGRRMDQGVGQRDVKALGTGHRLLGRREDGRPAVGHGGDEAGQAQLPVGRPAAAPAPAADGAGEEEDGGDRDQGPAGEDARAPAHHRCLTRTGPGGRDSRQRWSLVG
jgi:hypothetical protein